MATSTDVAAIEEREYCRDQIAARLKAKGWKRADLCRATGISKQSMSQYMAATAMPSKESLRKIAIALDCQTTVFLRSFQPEGEEYCEVRESAIPNYKIFMCRVALPATLALAMAQQVVEHIETRTPPSAHVEAVAAASSEKKQQGKPKRASAKP